MLNKNAYLRSQWEWYPTPAVRSAAPSPSWRRDTRSAEAGLKYFVLGALASGFLLYGLSMIYGATGTLSLSEAGKSLASAGDTTLGVIGLALLAVGLLFKVGAVPFGSWVPDVYQGAPTPVTAFMASATKVAAFVALARVFYVTFDSLADYWRPALWVVAIATMVIATLMAVSQDDIKRMFAYSSMVHAGFLLLGVIALSEAGLAALLFYLATYAFSAFGGFALLSVVRDGAGREATGFDSWAGLGRRRPLVGALFALFLLAFAGIPLTTGFVAKFVVFAAAELAVPGRCLSDQSVPRAAHDKLALGRGALGDIDPTLEWDLGVAHPHRVCRDIDH